MDRIHLKVLNYKSCERIAIGVLFVEHERAALYGGAKSTLNCSHPINPIKMMILGKALRGVLLKSKTGNIADLFRRIAYFHYPESNKPYWILNIILYGTVWGDNIHGHETWHINEIN